MLEIVVRDDEETPPILTEDRREVLFGRIYNKFNSCLYDIIMHLIYVTFCQIDYIVNVATKCDNGLLMIQILMRDCMPRWLF